MRDRGTRLKSPNWWQFAQATCCLICALLTLRATDGYEGTEFSGGWLTGPLLSFAEIGVLLFVLALVGTFVLTRVAAVVGTGAALLSLPLFLFFFAPVPFARLVAPGHEFSVMPSPGLHWETGTVSGLVMLGITIALCVRNGTRRQAELRMAGV